jgi:hypothetical protein
MSLGSHGQGDWLVADLVGRSGITHAAYGPPRCGHLIVKACTTAATTTNHSIDRCLAAGPLAKLHNTS